MVCITPASEFITLDIQQYIEGGLTPATYIFNNCREEIYEYNVEPGFYRRSIMNRDYLLEGYGLTGTRIVEERVAEAEEQAANLALVKGEIEYSKQKNTAKVAEIIQSNKKGNADQVKEQDDEINNVREEH